MVHGDNGIVGPLVPLPVELGKRPVLAHATIPTRNMEGEIVPFIYLQEKPKIFHAPLLIVQVSLLQNQIISVRNSELSNEISS